MYDQLDKSAREIRLLEIQPSTELSQQLQCRLLTVSLYNKPVYEALSYCWGQGTHPTTIMVDGNERSISTNLFLALERLRNEQTPRVIWIDSICIDQSNNVEKAHQVSFMRDIYRSASQVIVWLGAHSLYEGTWELIDDLQYLERGSVINWSLIYHSFPDLLYGPENYDADKFEPFVLGFKTLCLLAKDTHITDMPHIPPSHFAEEISDEDMRRAQALSSFPGMTGGLLDLDQFSVWVAACGALLLVLTRSYWTRIWIIQEIVLGEKDPVVCFGRHLIPFSLLVDAERNLAKHYYGCCAGWGRDAMGAKYTKITSLLKELAVVRDLERLRQSVHSGSIMSLTDVLRNLHTNAERDATDPRDQIYGVLGLVNALESDPMVPNYNLSVAEVYTQAMFHMISDARSLAPLVFAEGQRHEELHLPSWVPDWTGTSYFQPTPYPWELYWAYPGRTNTCELLEGSVLRVKGTIVDSVKRTAGRMISDHQQVRSLLMRFGQWRLAMQEAGERLEANSIDDFFGFEPSPDGSTTPSANEVFWRIILGDSLLTEDSNSQRLGPDDICNVSKWWKWLVDGAKNKTVSQGEEWAGLKNKVPLEYRDIFHAICERTRSRIFFTTERGRCGMGISIIKDVSFGIEDIVTEIETGDFVCLLEGSRLPVVLRKHLPNADGAEATASESVQLRYSYLGTCYIHGIMDGEAVPNPDELVDIHIGDFQHRNPVVRPKERRGRPVGLSNLGGPLQNLISTVHGHGRETKKSKGIDYQSTALRRFLDKPSSDEASGSSVPEQPRESLMGKALFAEMKARGLFTKKEEEE